MNLMVGYETYVAFVYFDSFPSTAGFVAGKVTLNVGGEKRGDFLRFPLGFEGLMLSEVSNRVFS